MRRTNPQWEKQTQIPTSQICTSKLLVKSFNDTRQEQDNSKRSLNWSQSQTAQLLMWRDEEEVEEGEGRQN